MAIVNSLAVGKAKGSAGNINFYQRMGETIMREKVLHPTNPRTKSQMTNRAKFMNAILFFAVLISKNASALWENKTKGTKKLTGYQNYLKQNLAITQPYIPKPFIELRKIIPAPIIVCKQKGKTSTIVTQEYNDTAKRVIFTINANIFNFPKNTMVSFIVQFGNVNNNKGTDNGVIRSYIDAATFSVQTQYFGIKPQDVTVAISTPQPNTTAITIYAENPTILTITAYTHILTELQKGKLNRNKAIMQLTPNGQAQYNYYTTGEGAAEAINSYPSGQAEDFYSPITT
ncbi:MAG: hypothetical protein LBP63_10035 [Prevotellaceae bacterium]|jgi:hypothetical protein|nr:hypothetical protein [Prevotellaceae bacterium]